MFDKEVYIQRRNRLAQTVGSGIILIPGNFDSPYNYKGNVYPFRQDSNFLYFCGLDYPDLFLIIDTFNSKSILFADDADIDDIIWTGPQLSSLDKASSAGIDKVLPFNDLYKYIHAQTELHYITPYRSDVAKLLSELTGFAQNDLINHRSEKLISACVEMRKVKEEVEIKQIVQAIDITCDMHNAARNLILNNSDLTERDVCAHIYQQCIAQGYYMSFAPIVTMHGEVFHGGSTSQKLQNGKMLLIDIGAENFMHYAGDMTRTLPAGCTFSSQQQNIYDIVLKTQQTIAQTARPGLLWRDMHKLAGSVIARGLKDLNIMKGSVEDIVESGAYCMFFPHGLGHLLGLDVHDMESFDENLVGYNQTVKRSEKFGENCLRYGLELKPGMFITDEPGIYFIPQLIDMWRKEKRFIDFINYEEIEKYKSFSGIRIEDDLLITQDGCCIPGKGAWK